MLLDLNSSIVGLKKLIRFPFISVNDKRSLMLHNIESSAAFFNSPAFLLLNVILINKYYYEVEFER